MSSGPTSDDDFAKNYPDFDWRNTDMHKHPKDCRCPLHEMIDENVNIYLAIKKQMQNDGKKAEAKDLKVMTIKLCPEHYDEFYGNINKLSWLERKLVMFFFKKICKVEIIKLSVMLSDECFSCKYGKGRKKKSEIPPPPAA